MTTLKSDPINSISMNDSLTKHNQFHFQLSYAIIILQNNLLESSTTNNTYNSFLSDAPNTAFLLHSTHTNIYFTMVHTPSTPMYPYMSIIYTKASYFTSKKFSHHVSIPLSHTLKYTYHIIICYMYHQIFSYNNILIIQP